MVGDIAEATDAAVSPFPPPLSPPVGASSTSAELAFFLPVFFLFFGPAPSSAAPSLRLLLFFFPSPHHPIPGQLYTKKRKRKSPPYNKRGGERGKEKLSPYPSPFSV